MRMKGQSLKKDFLKFIVPSIVAQWVYTLYTMVDGIFVARGVSETALTAVNLSFPYLSGLFSISILFAVGMSTVVAILRGRDENAKACEVFTQNIVLLTILSVVLSAAVLLNLRRFALFLGATKASLPFVMEYIKTLAPFTAAFILSYTFEILMKTDGFPGKATRIVVTGCIGNIIMDYIFVMVFHWGVFGAAFATGISQTAVIVFYMIHFGKKKGVLGFKKFPFRKSLIWREFKNGLPSGLTEFSAGIIIFFFSQAILRYIGETALVSYTIISYVNSIVVMSMNGVAQGTQPLVSYFYGRGDEEKIKKLLHYSVVASVVLAVAAFAVCWFGADPIVSLFMKGDMPELRAYSDKVFRIFSVSFLVVGFNVVVGGYFTAIEKPVEALLISLARGFVTMLLSLFIMTHIFGGAGIWWSALVSEIMCLVLTGVLYKKQKSIF